MIVITAKRLLKLVNSDTLQSSPIWLYITTHIMETSKVVISSNTVHQQPYKKEVSNTVILSSNSPRNLRPIHYPPVTILHQFTGTGTTPWTQVVVAQRK